MSTRTYDYILGVANAYNFRAGNTVVGQSSGVQALVVNVNMSTNTLKVKMFNDFQTFQSGETITSNSTNYLEGTGVISYSNNYVTTLYSNSYFIDGSTNTFALPSTGLSTYYPDSIDVYINNFLLPKQAWVWPSSNALGNTGITIKPLNYTKTLESDNTNLTVKVGSVVVDNYYQVDPDVPNTDTDIQRTQSALRSYSNVVPYMDMQRYFTGTAADVANSVPYSLTIPTANVANLTIFMTFANVNSAAFFAGYKDNEYTTASSVITSTAYNAPRFIVAKNADEVQPIVRLYSIYYPGEWYPSNQYGNPSTQHLYGMQLPWPKNFPLRFAEVRGDYLSDINYTIRYGGVDYTPYPVDSTGISVDSSGKINDVTLTVSNFDSLITQLIENPYLAGRDTSYGTGSSGYGTVNGQICYNIDPRTSPTSPGFDQGTADTLGYNIPMDRTTTLSLGHTWYSLKQDSRDLLGAIVEIKTTFAHLLDFWPEYSTILEKTNGNYLRMRTTSPYRVGDIIHSDRNNMSSASSTILQIVHPYLVVSNADFFSIGQQLYIQNPEASSDEYVLDTFKVNNLEALDETAAKFSLTSWLQYFKNTIPSRSYFKNSCPWVYKGDECKYPASGTGQIQGTWRNANGYFTINNETTTNPDLDVCSKNDYACALRNNRVNFGGFPGTGVSLPR